MGRVRCPLHPQKSWNLRRIPFVYINSVAKLSGHSPSAFFQTILIKDRRQPMAEHVCPWWIGYLLASPARRWMGDSPESLLEPYVRPGMIALEPGPGMGFFTLPLARMVGPSGRVVAVDIQPRMLASLSRRARKAGLSDRIETRLAKPDQMNLEALDRSVDFVLAYAVVHEMPSAAMFFRQAAAALKPAGILLFAEPAGHVKPQDFQMELDAARSAGFTVISRPSVRRCHAAVLRIV